jgi:hypothetical protein
LDIVFTSKLRYSARINQLFEAAEGSKGYAELIGTTVDDLVNEEASDEHDSAPEENGDDDVEQDHSHFDEADEEYEAHAADVTEEHGDDNEDANYVPESYAEQDDGENDEAEAQQEDLNVPPEDAYEDEEEYVQEQHDVPQESASQLGDDVVETEHVAFSQTLAEPVAADVGNDPSQQDPATNTIAEKNPVAKEPDEIDYSDAEDDAPPKTPSANDFAQSGFVEDQQQDAEDGQIDDEVKDTDKSTVLESAHLGEDLKQIEDDGKSDFELDIYGNDDGANPTAETASGTNTATLDGDVEVELQRSLSEQGLSPAASQKSAGLSQRSAEEEDEIDWDEDEGDAQKAGVGSGPTGGSPLGKRNWEHHSEGLVEVGDGQGQNSSKRICLSLY